MSIEVMGSRETTVRVIAEFADGEVAVRAQQTADLASRVIVVDVQRVAPKLTDGAAAPLSHVHRVEVMRRHPVLAAKRLTTSALRTLRISAHLSEQALSIALIPATLLCRSARFAQGVAAEMSALL